MLLLKSKSRRQNDSQLPPPSSDGPISVPISGTMRSAIVQIAIKWELTVEEASRRIMVMSLSGWKLKFSSYMTELSVFCSDQVDPFQSTCIVMRNWLVQHEKGMEEAFSDPDVLARLEMILDALQEKRSGGQKADLNEILAEDELEDAI
ncbi:MAG: hypothetical protein O7G85_16080 [Planctomycetota bacterium]|nr:hypothetical protein [Planctomycetota bacterium]